MNFNSKKIVDLNKNNFMSTIDLVQKKVANLPKEVQLQVLDFVNFLAEKYSIEEDEAILQAFLLNRAASVKKENRISANELRKKVLNKYDKNV